MHTHTYTQARTHMHMHAHTQMRVRTYTQHTHTHTHTHKLVIHSPWSVRLASDETTEPSTLTAVHVYPVSSPAVATRILSSLLEVVLAVWLTDIFTSPGCAIISPPVLFQEMLRGCTPIASHKNVTEPPNTATVLAGGRMITGAAQRRKKKN